MRVRHMGKDWELVDTRRSITNGSQSWLIRREVDGVVDIKWTPKGRCRQIKEEREYEKLGFR